uniref:Uncharacterized protein n=1 Tax=Megaselia scalaris TaxID=36166 RepID=T1GJM6_MEGSC
MAFGTMTSLLGMIPILAIGMNYFRYAKIDPENKVSEPDQQSAIDKSHRLMSLMKGAISLTGD